MKPDYRFHLFYLRCSVVKSIYFPQVGLKVPQVEFKVPQVELKIPQVTLKILK